MKVKTAAALLALFFICALLLPAPAQAESLTLDVTQ